MIILGILCINLLYVRVYVCMCDVRQPNSLYSSLGHKPSLFLLCVQLSPFPSRSDVVPGGCVDGDVADPGRDMHRPYRQVRP